VRKAHAGVFRTPVRGRPGGSLRHRAQPRRPSAVAEWGRTPADIDRLPLTTETRRCEFCAGIVMASAHRGCDGRRVDHLI
jgi:hypothetical protein